MPFPAVPSPSFSPHIMWITRLIALILTAAAGVLLHRTSTQPSPAIADHHAALLHLLATTLSTGLQLWTTFGFGIIAFKTLPRHTFGHLQSKLFVPYFAIVTVCTSLNLLTLFIMTNKLATPAAQFQFKVRNAPIQNVCCYHDGHRCCSRRWAVQCSTLPFLVRLCTNTPQHGVVHPLLSGCAADTTHHAHMSIHINTEPATTSVMKQRHVFEKKHSSTQGGPSSAEMAKLKATFPQYKAMCSRFGAYHSLSSLANLGTLAACLTHVWFLSTKLKL